MARPRKTYSKAYARKRTQRRTYKKRTYKLRARPVRRKSSMMRGPKAGDCGSSKKEMRALIKQNEDLCLVYSDSQTYGTSAQTSYMYSIVGDTQMGYANDFDQMFPMIPPPLKSGVYNQSIILKSGQHEVMFCNQDNQIISFKVWIVRAQRDIPVQGSNTQYYHAAYAWELGVEGSQYGAVPYSNNPPNTAQGYNNPGSDPHDSVVFDRFYYVLKKKTFVLLPGRVKTIRYSLGNLPYKIQNGVDAELYGGTKGITMACLYQATGAPFIAAAGTGSGVVGNSYYTTPSFSVMENKRYHFTYSADSNKALNYNTNWVPSIPSVTVNGQLTVNPLGGYANQTGVPVSAAPTQPSGTYLNVTGPGTGGSFPIIPTASVPIVVIGTGGSATATAVVTHAV